MSDVWALLRARRHRRSRAPHGDGARIALAVEGGAMRGVISAGMVWALEDLGFRDAFDAVYGSSAGAINAAYFLGGRAGIGTTIFFEDINTASFIDLWRPLGGRPIVDLGFLLDDVAVRRKPLPVDQVLAAASPLTVLATDVDQGCAAALRGFRDDASLRSALRAGATMPVVAGAPHPHDGHRYLDASLSEPIPIVTAEAEGHTHIVALLTRSGDMRPHPSAFDRYYVAPRLKRVSRPLASQYLARAEPYGRVIACINRGTGPRGLAQVAAIRAEGCRISRLECRKAVLEDGARRGYAAVTAVLG
jgi:predicted patatin/cPLA2 family phospholipase